jgi:hypothetical protein
LLGGLIVCAKCGGKLHASTRINGVRRYVCPISPGRAGCGRVAIKAEPLEEIVVEVVMGRLDGPDLARAVSAPKGSPEREIPDLENRQAELADLFGASEITRAEWMRARKGIEGRLSKARARRDAEAGVSVLSPFRGSGVLRDAWPNLSTDQRRAILGAVIERVVIAPAEMSGRFDAERISIEWRA